MSEAILVMMLWAVWFIAIMGIVCWPIWVVEYRKIQRLREIERYEAEREEQAREFFESLTPEERARVDRAAQALTDVMNASTISIKDLEWGYD